MALKIGGIIGGALTSIAESINIRIKDGSGVRIVLLGGLFPIKYSKWR